MPTDPDAPTDSEQIDSEEIDSAPAPPARGDSRSVRAAKVAAAQRARGSSTGPNDRPRAPKSLKRI